ncbi:UNVERIFIED_CONTAM: hypothetical protein Sradi_3060100 [Sesamum radiatum]|uniref:Uncharacterized protein n=1 Tax=Sesamum radiatum TaxID=300843 RepID=A0AAW2RD22_SESRA
MTPTPGEGRRRCCHPAENWVTATAPRPSPGCGGLAPLRGSSVGRDWGGHGGRGRGGGGGFRVRREIKKVSNQ